MASNLDNAIAAAKRLEINRKYIPHDPTPNQLAFIACDAFEVLYGGAAGGGKSDGILMDLLQWVHVPNYAGIGFRRTYADLVLPGALIDRSHQWLERTDAAWNGDRKQWRFPSGAVVTFGYLDKDLDKYRYQSAEFQRIDFDELTHFQKAPYTYMLSRCRRRIGIDVPPAVRCGSNPGGTGHIWVKERFVDVETREGRVFMPAGLKDNPYLDADEYRAALMNLSKTEQNQLLDGIWEEGEVEGAYYGALMATLAENGHLTSVPYEPTLPVYTAWDLGMDDETAIWMFQDVRGERRFIDYYQCSGEALQHYVNELNRRPYVFQNNYFPPDVQVRELSSGKSRKETLESLGLRVTVLKPHTVEDGIQAVRDVLPKCWFDLKNCKNGLQCLRNYRKEWDEKRQTFRTIPLHDWASHGADAFRYGVMGYQPTPKPSKAPKYREGEDYSHAGY
jgi:hypothetical protein